LQAGGISAHLAAAARHEVQLWPGRRLRGSEIGNSRVHSRRGDPQVCVVRDSFLDQGIQPRLAE